MTPSEIPIIEVETPDMASILSDILMPKISTINVILGIISIILIIVALNKKANKKVLVIWIIMYIVSAVTRITFESILTFATSEYMKYPIAYLVGRYSFMIITTILRIIMVIYPICIVRKNKKEN